jgi:hypothetical protein
MKRLASTAVAVAMAVLTGCAGSTTTVPDGLGQPAQSPTRYRLLMPETVAGGSYKTTEHGDPDEGLARSMAGQMETPVSAFSAYDGPDWPGKKYGPVLSITGVYGTVLSPVTARDAFLRLLDERWDPPQSVIVGPRTVTPPGSTEPLLCRVTQRPHKDGFTSFEPDCTWADASAVVSVGQTTDLKTAPSDVDINAFASLVASIRNEVRIEIK